MALTAREKNNMKKQEKINYTTGPIPSGPGPQQITVVGQSVKKGSSDFSGTIPSKYIVPNPGGQNKIQVGGQGSKNN